MMGTHHSRALLKEVIQPAYNCCCKRGANCPHTDEIGLHACFDMLLNEAIKRCYSHC